MKCPYCGAELQENARFCLYCMKSLQEKQSIGAPSAKKRRLRIALIAAALAAAAAIAVLLLLRQKQAPPAVTEPETAATEAEAEPTQPAAKTELPPLTDPNDFYFAAVAESERLGADDLWEPASIWFPDEACAVVPLLLPEADCRVCFLQDGRAILAAMTNLTGETLADGQQIAACIHAAVYENIADAPALPTGLPTEPAERSLLEELQIDDPADAGTVTGIARCRERSGQGEQYLLCELRTRNCDDGIYYDIFLYFGQE